MQNCKKSICNCKGGRMMKFSKLKKTVMRKSLEKTNFYKDVFFSDDFCKKYSQKVIYEWIYNLEKYKHIKVKKFNTLI